jgi:hypothetical protein
MTNTIYDIIWRCREKYGLELTSQNTPKYIGLVKRQEILHPEYDLNYRTGHYKCRSTFIYLNLSMNKLLLFSYIIGETTITAGFTDYEVEKRIGYHLGSEWDLKPKKERKKDLYLLRPSELGGNIGGDLRGIERAERMALRQTDRKLLSLHGRLNSDYSRFKQPFLSWGGAIDELGRDREVVRFFGQIITYEMVKACHSPNPLTFDHGGKRKGAGSRIHAERIQNQ